MTEVSHIIETFEFAKKAKKKKKYLLAARLYRLCTIYYENGELGPYDPDVKKFGTSASDKYEKCISKLSHSEQEMLDAEEAKYFPENGSYFIWEWRNFVKEERERIDENDLKLLYEESTKSHSAMSIFTNLKTFVQKHLTRCNCWSFQRKFYNKNIEHLDYE